MPLKEDNISCSFFSRAETESAAELLDSSYAGIICDKNGNILYINDRAKSKEPKDDVSNILALVPEQDINHVRNMLLEDKSCAYEIRPYEHLIVFPADKKLKAIILLNLSPKNFEDLHSLLRESTRHLRLLERTMTGKSKSDSALAKTVSDRISRIMQLLELETLSPNPYSEITYDLSELTKMLSTYANDALSDFDGCVLLNCAAAIFTRITPEVFAMLYCACISLVICQSENPKMEISLLPNPHEKGLCCIRFRSAGFSESSRLYMNFLEFTCFKLGIECSTLSDRENNITEFSMFIETEESTSSRVKSAPYDSEIYNISHYLSILSGRLYTHI